MLEHLKLSPVPGLTPREIPGPIRRPVVHEQDFALKAISPEGVPELSNQIGDDWRLVKSGNDDRKIPAIGLGD